MIVHDLLLLTLQTRFEKHPARHAGISWKTVEARLEKFPKALSSLQQMEDSGGEPDVVGLDSKSGSILFMDCSEQSPAGRRSLCFDRPAWESRKENKPTGSAMEMAESMGISLLTEDQYRFLQTLGSFDTKTSSWVQTPQRIRDLGGALFCDRRYDTVFTYHNGAESYYAARGFRGVIVIGEM